MRLDWRPRERPLIPVAAFAYGPARDALERAWALTDALQQLRLRRIEHDAGLLLIGHDDDLPWSEGVGYLGRCEQAPNLLLPTLLEPTVPLDLLERACARRAAAARWLLWAQPALLWALPS